jgi:hypothetical protein
MESTLGALMVVPLYPNQFEAFMNPLSVLTPIFVTFLWIMADTVEAYESGKLAKLLNIEVKDDPWVAF